METNYAVVVTFFAKKISFNFCYQRKFAGMDFFKLKQFYAHFKKANIELTKWPHTEFIPSDVIQAQTLDFKATTFE